MSRCVVPLIFGVLVALCSAGCGAGQQSADDAANVAAQAKQRNNQLQQQRPVSGTAQR
jgi:hypothetical protein